VTHIIRLLAGDKRNPTRTLDLTGSGIYLSWEGLNPTAGQLSTVYSGKSARFDGQRRLMASRDNTKLQLRYDLDAGSTAELRLLQRQIDRFINEVGLYHEQYRAEPVYLEYRWSDNSALDDLPRPVWGQLNYYLEILQLDVKYPDSLHTGALAGGYIAEMVMDITGGPYWEGLEQLAGIAGDYANESDTGIKYDFFDGELNGDYTIAGWTTHDTSGNYAICASYGDDGIGPHTLLYWDNTDGRFEVRTRVSSSNTTTNGNTGLGIANGANVHLALIHNDTTNELKVYVNGTLDITVSGYTPSASYCVLMLGSFDDNYLSAPTASDNTTGLDAWRVWDSNITTTQLSALYIVEVALKAAGYAIQYPIYCWIDVYDFSVLLPFEATGVLPDEDYGRLSLIEDGDHDAGLPWFAIYGAAGDTTGNARMVIPAKSPDTISYLRSLWVGQFVTGSSYDPHDIHLHQFDSDDGSANAAASNNYAATTTSSGAGTDTHTFTKTITTEASIAAMRGRYRVFAGLAADNDEADVTFTWDIGDTEIQQSTIEVEVSDSNGAFEVFDLGEIVIDWPDKTPPAEINLNVTFTETSATATDWYCDFILLLPYPAFNLTIGEALSWAVADNAIVIANRQAWTIDASDKRREASFNYVGDTIGMVPDSYNYILVAADSPSTITLFSRVELMPHLYHTPRWRLPGPMAA
jgi:hypothetical protein